MFISPVGGHLLGLSVVSGQSMDSAFNENESILTILILPVLLHMFPNTQCLLNHIVKVFRNSRGTPILLQDPQDLLPVQEPHLGNTMLVSQ